MYGLVMNMGKEEFILSQSTKNLRSLGKAEQEKIHFLVDVGAHVGSVSLYAAKILGVRRVVAVEANPDNVAHLRKYIELNGVGTQVRIIPKAVGFRTAGRRGFHVVNSGQGSLNYRQDWKPNYWVEIITLEEVLADLPTVDYLKVDIEGGEFEILVPTNETRELLSRVRWLDLDIHPPTTEHFDGESFCHVRVCYSPYAPLAIQLLTFLRSCGFKDGSDERILSENPYNLFSYNSEYKE